MIEELQSSGGHPGAWDYTIKRMHKLLELKRLRVRREQRDLIGIHALANGADPSKVHKFLMADDPE